MAAPSNQSSLAPTDFNLSRSTSFDGSPGAITVAVERCQLCTRSRRPFYCKSCVQTGDFYHSKNKQERYAEKLKRWHRLKRERLKVLEKIQQKIKRQLEIDKKNCELKCGRERVKYLQNTLEEEQQKHRTAQDAVRKLREGNQIRNAKARRHLEKKSRITHYIDQTKANISRHNSNLHERMEELGVRRKDLVHMLLQYIFPVKELQLKSDSTDNMAMSTVSALAEARRTSYVHGRWVYTDNGGEHQYRIVEPTLPGGGDYSAYNLWVLTNKESVPAADTDLNQRNPAYTISAALCYTTQLLSLIAYFLDVHLPRRLCYSEFCGSELTEKQFSHKVNKLNYNILYICFNQKVDAELIHPKHTIHNLQLLLNAQELGRVGPFEIHPEMTCSFEDSDLDESDEQSVYEEEEADGYDWERVPVTLPEDIPRFTDASMTTQVAMAQTTPVPSGGLMSSAAASVAQLWRAATSHMERK